MNGTILIAAAAALCASCFANAGDGDAKEAGLVGGATIHPPPDRVATLVQMQPGLTGYPR